MPVIQYSWWGPGDGSIWPSLWVADTLAERPNTVLAGDQCYVGETAKFYIRQGASWEEPALAAHSHPGGFEAFPVGSIFISAVATNPATLLGYGTWASFGAGRILVGQDPGDPDFDTALETGGAKTHSHAAHSGVISHTHPVTDPGHTHVEQTNSATTGALVGWPARDTSTATPVATGYSTRSATTGVTTQNPAGGVASLTHDAPSHMPPYIVAYLWRRTA